MIQIQSSSFLLQKTVSIFVSIQKSSLIICIQSIFYYDVFISEIYNILWLY